ncbi:efflux RND transporter periplasmic adaptor subunit [Pedobacter antarcticus]|uniref:efflux RND transporter periplasmic adaptor subunit n=1 Tax=Pedobacter antarcticus TaxID=34086 RepID=UPI00292F34A7|nr:efflux RND transporter periplasmic adaptor subunit [Pedobacter antarcticus]
MKLKYLIYTLLVAGIAYLIYYRISANQKIGASSNGGGASGGKAPTLNVTGVVVQPAPFADNLEVTGTIEANEAVALQSEVSGLVTGIYFTEGGQVTKGALLVKINDRDIQAQLQESLTKQNLSATNEGRARQLLDKGAISQEEYDTALADLKSLQAQAQLIRAQLAKTSILAPFSGKIGLRSISQGEYITPTTIIANLLNTNPVKINFSVPEKYMAQIKNGATVTFRTDGSNHMYTGKVFAIEPGINSQTRTLQIKALAQNEHQELRPGSFAKISLTLDKIEDAIMVPNQAIIPVLKGKTVFIARNGKAKQVEVHSGTRTDQNILITSGLSVGDTVLTSGALSLKDDAAVHVTLVQQK